MVEKVRNLSDGRRRFDPRNHHNVVVNYAGSTTNDADVLALASSFAESLWGNVEGLEAVFVQTASEYPEIITVMRDVTMDKSRAVFRIQRDTKGKFPNVDAYFQLRRRESVDLDELRRTWYEVPLDR